MLEKYRRIHLRIIQDKQFCKCRWMPTISLCKIAVFLLYSKPFTTGGYHSWQTSVQDLCTRPVDSEGELTQLTNCFWRRLAQNSKSKRPSGGSPMQSNTASAITKSSSAVYLFNTRRWGPLLFRLTNKFSMLLVCLGFQLTVPNPSAPFPFSALVFLVFILKFKPLQC